ncbi:hypothetical protein E4K10_34900 [Streptomyces sp. T1317-0309]|nr:hypothetical protein E4K10_34900 [Streptomyces sp. T1317-0309]
MLTLCPTANELPCVRPSGHPAVRRCRRCRRGAVDAALSTLAESGLPPTDVHGPAELFGIVGLDGWLDWSQEYTRSTAAGSATD